LPRPRTTSPAAAPSRQASGPAARAHDAYTYLLMELLEGELMPGDWLSVVAVANRLECSRVPIMEAVKRLAGEGFLTIVPQVGCRVVRPLPDEVHDFFTLFAAVEGCVTRLAAERRTAEDLLQFKQVCQRVDVMLKAAGGPTSRDPAYRRANLLFHQELHRLARAPSACAIAANLWDRSDFYIKAAFGSLYFSSAVRRAHAAIRRAVTQGDPEAAEVAVERHLRAVGEGVSGRLRADSPGTPRAPWR